jgi:hypothetical protein
MEIEPPPQIIPRFGIASSALAALAVLFVACDAVQQPAAVSGGRPGSSLTQSEQGPEAPVLVRLPNGHYRVKRPWKLQFNGNYYLIPAGYSSNGITAPARVRAALGDGITHPETWAAVFHDWLFTRKNNQRARADRQFYELLLAYGVDDRKARLMYSTVSAYSLSKDFN